MEIILSEEQQKAINSSIDFINSNKTEFLISGYAGTGKTLLIKEIIKYLEKRGIHYTLCAPTHRAKVVLEKFTAREGITIHKLLSLSPMIEIMHLDFNNLKFIQNNGFQFPRNAIIICDEASMINDDLFDLLSDRAKKNNCKLITVGENCPYLFNCWDIFRANYTTTENRIDLNVTVKKII